MAFVFKFDVHHNGQKFAKGVQVPKEIAAKMLEKGYVDEVKEAAALEPAPAVVPSRRKGASELPKEPE